jgi:hypothetical protein
MCFLMFRQLWLARERFRETSQGPAGSLHVSWNTGHSNSCFIRFTCTNEAQGHSDCIVGNTLPAR